MPYLNNAVLGHVIPQLTEYNLQYLRIMLLSDWLAAN